MLVTGTAAQIARERHPDFCFSWIGVLFQKRNQRHQKTRRTKAALQAMRDFRVLAMASVYGAILSGVLVSITLYLFEPETTLVGILAAEAFMAIYLTRILYTRLQATS